MSLPQTLSPATSTTPRLDLLVEKPEGRLAVPESASPSTRTGAVRAGIDDDAGFGAVMPPLYLSSNFSFESLGRQRRYDYTRSGNPTRELLAETLAELEGGHSAVVTSSGMSAIHLALQLLEPGARVVASYDCYGGTHRLLAALVRRGLVEVDFADLTSRASAARALASPVDLVWVETPSNPLLRITDLAAVASLARSANPAALVAVDNTFLSPAAQRPLDFGADLVVHSTTKYLNGHSDVVGGAVVAKDPDVGERLAWWANCLGLGGAPFDSYLTLRGLRTLHARLAAHQENAAAVAELLAGHEAVARAYYPGLEGHPGHALASRQQQGFGGIVSFELRGGEAAVAAFTGGLECFTLAESLGGVESLVAHPATMTHAAMEPGARRRAGIGDGLVRLSVGIEAKRDLLADLARGLGRALAVTSKDSQAAGFESAGGASCAC